MGSDTVNKTTHPFFIENGADRAQTATLLVGTADEFGIDQRDICAVQGGFRISAALADILNEPGAEPVLDNPDESGTVSPDESETESETETDTQTSGDPAEETHGPAENDENKE